MAKVNKSGGRIPASSLLEVVIAMVLIMVVFGIALTIFTNVTRSSLSAQKMRAQALAGETLLRFEHGVTDSISFKVDDLTIETQAEVGQQPAGLQKVTITVYAPNRQKITEVSKLMNKADEQKN